MIEQEPAGAQGGGPIVAAILAAGKGRRLGGRHKAALRLPSGESFAAAIVRSVRTAGIARCVLVLRPGAPCPEDLDPAAFACVRNPDPDRSGMLGSIHAALESEAARGAGALLVWPVDCPRVPPAVVRALCAAFAARGAPIVAPACEGRRGHPVLFAAALFDALRAAPPDQGARAVVRAHAALREVVETHCPAVLDDIDTPERLFFVQGGRGGVGARWPCNGA